MVSGPARASDVSVHPGTETPSPTNDTAAGLIVTLCCRSSAKVSVWVLPCSTLPISSVTPTAMSGRSVKLVLPASACAKMPGWKIPVRIAFVEETADHWTLQRLPQVTLLSRGPWSEPDEKPAQSIKRRSQTSVRSLFRNRWPKLCRKASRS